MDLTGVIVAGGKSTRMGGTKCFLEVGGVPVIERQIAVLREIVPEILIVTNEPAKFLHLGIPLVSDLFFRCGSVAGIHAGLFNSPGERILAVACDMPFVRPEVLRHIAERDRSADVAVPRVGEYYEPLMACYSRRCLRHIERSMRAGKKRIVEFFSGVKVREIPEEELRRFDPDLLCLWNVNTPEDLERARRKADQLKG